jgi:hypothetical protein
MSENGTYTLSGNTIALTPASGQAGTPAQYCVKGSTLLIETQPPNAGGPSIVLAATKL